MLKAEASVMLRYSPPKSSFWGHRLRKMKPSVQKERTEKFKEIVKIEALYNSYSLSILGRYDSEKFCFDKEDSARITQQFERLLNRKPDPSKECFELTDHEFSGCLEQLIRMEDEFKHINADILLSHHLAIKFWKIPHKTPGHDSGLTCSFGTMPYLGTGFVFRDRSEYDYVAKVLSGLSICRLSDTRLKGK
ncbi:MAG TPA: hypothetical protein ACFE0H_06840 [Elainellaceae cyanobacterium]